MLVGAVLSGEVPVGAPPGPIQVTGYALVVIETSPVASAVVSISGVLTLPSGGSPDYTLDFHLLGTVTSPASGGNLGPGSMVFASFTNPGPVSFAVTNQGAVQICSSAMSSGFVGIG